MLFYRGNRKATTMFRDLCRVQSVAFRVGNSPDSQGSSGQCEQSKSSICPQPPQPPSPTDQTHGWCLWDQGDKSKRVAVETGEVVRLYHQLLHPCQLPALHTSSPWVYLILLLATSTPLKATPALCPGLWISHQQAALLGFSVDLGCSRL